jgi:hypothetical protein
MSAERAPIKALLRGAQSVVRVIDSWSEPDFGEAHSRARFAVGCASSMP